MTQVRYNVRKSNIYRSWTKKTILPNQIGQWRVDVLDNNGTIIGSKKFEIKKVSDYNQFFEVFNYFYAVMLFKLSENDHSKYYSNKMGGTRP